MTRTRRLPVRLLVRLMGRHDEAGPLGLRLRAWMMRHIPGWLTCIEFELFVHDYQSGSLSAKERQAFDLHMELCPMCRVHFTTYLEMIELGKRVCTADEESSTTVVPEDLVKAILAARGAR